MMKTARRKWLITGADKGLGASAARAALERGDCVVVTVLDANGRHPLAADFPENFRAFHLDARDHARMSEVAKAADAAFGGVDVLINNAGYGLAALAEETPPEKYRPLFEVNFFGLTEMTRAVLPIMRRQRSGHIINLSSTAGFGAAAGFGFYSASKFAVEGYSEALAQEVRHLGIRVTIVEPGPFRSDFAGPSLDSMLSAIPDYAEKGAWVASYVKTRHGTQPNDPAKFGPAMCRLVDADDPPLRLPLGVEAIQHLKDEMAIVAGELDRWQDLSMSTTYRV